MPPRQTADLDIAVRARDVPATERVLEGAGWTRHGDLRLSGGLSGAAWVDEDGHEVDLVGVPGDLGDELVAAGQAERGHGLRFASREHPVMLKLIASRGRDIGDLTSMLGIATDDELDRVRETVRRHGTHEDVEDLEQLIVQGRLEQAR